MTLTSTAWPDGGQIPVEVHAGRRAKTRRRSRGPTRPTASSSFVLIVHDVDAADRQRHRRHAPLDGVEHSRDGDEARPSTCPRGAQLARRDAADQRDRSVLSRARRAAAGPPHHYVFELFALDIALDVPAVGAQPPQTRAAVVAAMAGHVRGKAVYVGLFKRQ